MGKVKSESKMDGGTSQTHEDARGDSLPLKEEAPDVPEQNFTQEDIEQLNLPKVLISWHLWLSKWCIYAELFANKA